MRENLRFAARLRLDSDAGGQRDDQAVEQALERVGLTEHADKRASVLSGGQRKRLSVAVELLKRPRILLLDEPTSGLDPASEANLMEQLRYVASRGTTVVCTTHLMENVRLLDSLIVLGVKDGVGRVAYVGPPAELLGHFGCRNFADLYEELSAGRFAPLTVGPRRRRRSESGDEKAHVPNLPGIAVACPSDASGKQRATGLSLRELITRAMVNSAPKQALSVGSRALLNIWRDRGLWLMMLAQPLVLGLLVSLTQFAATGLAPIYFFAVVISIWLGLNNSARDLVRDRKLYVRERLSGLRPGAYLGAKAAVYTLIGVVQLVILLVLHPPRLLAGAAAYSRRSPPVGLVGMASSDDCAMLSMRARHGTAGFRAGSHGGGRRGGLAAANHAATLAQRHDRGPGLRSNAKTRSGRSSRWRNDDGRAEPIHGRQAGGLPSLFCYSRPGTLLLEAPAVMVTAERSGWPICATCLFCSWAPGRSCSWRSSGRKRNGLG